MIKIIFISILTLFHLHTMFALENNYRKVEYEKGLAIGQKVPIFKLMTVMVNK